MVITQLQTLHSYTCMSVVFYGVLSLCVACLAFLHSCLDSQNFSFLYYHMLARQELAVTPNSEVVGLNLRLFAKVLKRKNVASHLSIFERTYF